MQVRNTLRLAVAVGISLAWLTSPCTSHAQVDIGFDGTFRSGSLIDQHALIDQAPGSRAGGNQFYSFERFHVPNGSSATFTSDGTQVNNVLARVTGMDASRIGGLLKSEWAGAHFFFMNPNGVVFSDGAQVDMAGSFTATTADYIEFADGIRFDNTATVGPPILSSADPVAFGFLAARPQAVSLDNTNVTVPDGDSINLIAGDVAIVGSTLETHGGALTIVAVGSPGTVNYQPNDPTSLPELQGFDALGNVDIQDSTLSTSPDPAVGGGGGRIVIRGGQLVVVDSRVSSDSSGSGTGQGVDIEVEGKLELHGSATVTSNANDSANGGPIRVRAGSLLIATPRASSPGFTLDQANLFGGITAANRGSGSGAPIDVGIAGEAKIEAGGVSSFSVLGSGRSGEVTFRAGELDVIGNPDTSFTGIQSVPAINAAGTSGDVNVKVDQRLTLLSGGSIRTSTFSNADGGDASVSAGSVLIDGQNAMGFTGVTSQSNSVTGNAGAVSVASAGQIEILGGGRISTNTNGKGNGAPVNVQAGSLRIDGSNTGFATGITAETQAPVGGGKAGSISVDVAGATELYSGGRISADTAGDGQGGSVSVRSGSIEAERRGSGFFTGIFALSTLDDGEGQGGDSGNIDVTAERIQMRDGALIDTSTFGSGNAGSLEVKAGDIHIDRAGSEFFTGIGSESDGSGKAGTVAVEADRLTLRNGGLIASGAFDTGAAGDVSVRAGKIDISGEGSVNDENVVTPRSGIVAGTGVNSSGVGGSVDVKADSLQVSNNGLVGANTAASGDAGSVAVDAGRIDLSSRGEIGSQSTGSGNAGSVDVRAHGDIRLDSDGRITVEAAESDAGSIAITSGGSLLMNRGSVNAVAGNDGGNITISARDFIGLDNGSEIVAEAGNDGGNVTLTDAKFAILNDSRISANAVNGTGGNIQIDTEVLLTNNSPITASSQFGADGTVRIDAIFDLSGSLTDLDEELLDLSAQLQPRCSVRIPGETGSFVLVGRGGLPTLPGRYMPSHQLLDLPE